MNGRFFKISQIWAEIGSNLGKFKKNRVIVLKIGPKIWPINIWSDFFLKNIIGIPRRYIPTKTKLEYPTGGHIASRDTN